MSKSVNSERNYQMKISAQNITVGQYIKHTIYGTCRVVNASDVAGGRRLSFKDHNHRTHRATFENNRMIEVVR